MHLNYLPLKIQELWSRIARFRFQNFGIEEKLETPRKIQELNILTPNFHIGWTQCISSWYKKLRIV
jgi:hypothetical protein